MLVAENCRLDDFNEDFVTVEEGEEIVYIIYEIMRTQIDWNEHCKQDV